MGYQSLRAMIAHKQPHYVLKPFFARLSTAEPSGN
jgi:hypothetical protein